MNAANQWMNGKALAIALFGGSADSTRGEWIIYGIKKANRMFHDQGREDLIFTGRLSTPVKVSQWLTDHPDFVPSQVLAPQRKKNQVPADPAPGRRPRRQPAAA